jgi:uncharacterized NAD(P)/FAD-binding protein YdhS
MRPVVGIIGGGAAGVLSAAGVVRAAGPQRSPDIVIVDPVVRLGAGTAYSTQAARHLLNVPAGRMGAFPDAPDGFLKWLHRSGHPQVAPADFVPRAWFADYLADCVNGLTARPIHLRDRVIELARVADGFELGMESGAVRQVNAAVLALGNLGPRLAWVPDELRWAPQFVADPWSPHALDPLREARSILLVGTGLTMVDLAVELASPGRTLTAISRSARLPHAHRVDPAPPIPAPGCLAQCSDLAALRVEIARHLDRCSDDCGDWRPAFDGLRPVTTELWKRLSEGERARAVAQTASWWNRHRHRMAPQVGEDIERLIAGRGLRIIRGEVRTAWARGAGLAVGLSDGSTLDVDAVVNCTGQEVDLRRLSDPLLTSLFESGIARPGPVGMGLDTTADGQILDGDGEPVPGLYTLGASRVGTLWESTAIPEIRAQAAQLGATIAQQFQPVELARLAG